MLKLPCDNEKVKYELNYRVILTIVIIGGTYKSSCTSTE